LKVIILLLRVIVKLSSIPIPVVVLGGTGGVPATKKIRIKY
jgi:hypothetical protein